MAAQELATAADMARLGLSAAVLAAAEVASPGCVAQALASKNAEATSYLRVRYTFPLVAWGDDVREAVCARAAIPIMTVLGFDPENPADKALWMRANEQLKWLKDVGAMQAHPEITESAPVVDAPVALSDEPQGW